jgi:hypothetical protein
MDLTFARLLDEVSQIYKTELLPGEVRVWKRCFTDEHPCIVEEAFAQYFKFGKFPPKPADIQAIITEKRQCAEYQDYIPPSVEEREALAVWHSSEEFQAFLKDWTAKIEASPMRRTTVEAAPERTPLDIETWDPQQLRQTKESKKADLAAWKDRRAK